MTGLRTLLAAGGSAALLLLATVAPARAHVFVDRGVNPWTGHAYRNVTVRNPWTGRVGSVTSVHIPWTGQTHWGVIGGRRWWRVATDELPLSGAALCAAPAQ
jgi:hypothetical protein